MKVLKVSITYEKLICYSWFAYYKVLIINLTLQAKSKQGVYHTGIPESPDFVLDVNDSLEIATSCNKSHDSSCTPMAVLYIAANGNVSCDFFLSIKRSLEITVNFNKRRDFVKGAFWSLIEIAVKGKYSHDLKQVLMGVYRLL